MVAFQIVTRSAAKRNSNASSGEAALKAVPAKITKPTQTSSKSSKRPQKLALRFANWNLYNVDPEPKEKEKERKITLRLLTSVQRVTKSGLLLKLRYVANPANILKNIRKDFVDRDEDPGHLSRTERWLDGLPDDGEYEVMATLQ